MSGDQEKANLTAGASTVSGPTVPISIVVPAYNEEKRLPASIRDLRAFFGGLKIPAEILIMVEKSTDQTLKAALEAAGKDPMIQVIDSQVHRGKGFAVRSGMLKARGEVVFFMDTDLSTPLSEVVAFLAHLGANPECHVLIGSRADSRSQIIKKQTWIRRNLGRGFNKFVQIFGVRGIKDTQCGFKAFRREACREIFSRQTIDGFAFDVEILLLAQNLGYRIDVAPVRWVNSPDSKVRIFIDPLKMFWDLIRIRRIVKRTVQAQPLSP